MAVEVRDAAVRPVENFDKVWEFSISLGALLGCCSSVIFLKFRKINNMNKF